MRLLHLLIGACFVIAAAQAVASALAVLLLLAVVYGLFAYPRQIFGLLAILVFVGLAERQPYLLLGLTGLAIASAWLFRKN